MHTFYMWEWRDRASAPVIWVNESVNKSSNSPIPSCVWGLPLGFCTGWTSYFRDWSLITGRGGLQNGRGGHVKFYPYEMGGGGGGKRLSHAEGGAQKVWGSFSAAAWCFSHIVGGRGEFPRFKRGGAKSFTLSWGGGGAQQVLDPRFSHLVAFSGGGGGHVKFYRYKKGGGGGSGKSFSHAEGGSQKVLG